MHALVEPSGNVADVAKSPFEVHPSLVWVRVPEGMPVQAGWSYDGSTFRTPEPDNGGRGGSVYGGNILSQGGRGGSGGERGGRGGDAFGAGILLGGDGGAGGISGGRGGDTGPVPRALQSKAEHRWAEWKTPAAILGVLGLLIAAAQLLL
ncbi:hypothetical protein [Roseococcus pinisoli]|uniref:Uncharacterized protein n=1 Tax=Roseococcus pinisoli TaxID=2835040 RepID=A0ABS5Q976_9PROT|nr:hypothetical protein [Roseococcus pinisoli]MBS7810259.1 hypothetical protein [Roseococcus pinisoli]